MALPIPEKAVESVRTVRVTDVRFDIGKDDRVIYANIDFKLKHHNEDVTVDECWAIVEVNPTQKNQLIQAGKDWHECKVELAIVENYLGHATIGVTRLLIAGVWVDPTRVVQTFRV